VNALLENFELEFVVRKDSPDFKESPKPLLTQTTLHSILKLDINKYQSANNFLTHGMIKDKGSRVDPLKLTTEYAFLNFDKEQT
jgi:hypothetical protein